MKTKDVKLVDPKIIHVQLDDIEYKKIIKKAKAEDRSISWTARQLLKAQLKEVV